MKPKIRLIGFDSMGSRGMATVVDLGELKVFIDPGVSYAPRRYGLPPHPIEEERLLKHLASIHSEVLDSDIIIISHYHRDHYLYRQGEEEYYRGKTLIIKDPLRNINPSQKIRAHILLNKMNAKNNAKEVLIADGKAYEYGDIVIEFSPPVPHGPSNTKLGYVVMTVIKTPDYVLMHASDVQGPIADKTMNYILRIDPDLLIMSGPPTYFEGFKMKPDIIEKGLANLLYLIENMRRNTTIIVDHHLLRDLNYRERLGEHIEKARKRNVTILTAAEYMNQPVEQLEALRKILWESGEK